MLTAFGVAAVSFMVATYALESRHPAFTAAFAGGCVLASAYGFLSGAWPFGAVELVWAAIAVRRWRTRLSESRRRSGSAPGMRPATDP